MCELLGLSFNEPVAADISIREFASRGADNPDGWGLAWYPDQSVAVVKEAIAWQSSKHTVFLESYPALRSKVYLGHVRHKTVGGPVTHADTHPFVRELYGREYCFAHNGTLTDLAEAFPLGRYSPVGQTDSEHVFCHLLDALAEEEIDLRAQHSWHWLHAKLVAMNQHGKMNVLLSDGRLLFCYHDLNGHKGLTWRSMPGANLRSTRLQDRELKVEVDVSTSQHGVAVASCALSGDGWSPMRVGELLVIQDGRLRYRQQRVAESLRQLSASA